VGVELNGGEASISGEIGGSLSWDIQIEGEDNLITLDATGNDVNLNGRVKVRLEIGWFEYHQEILRVSRRVGKAPDWSVTIRLPSTVLP